MVEALQLELKTAYQSREVMSEKEINFEQENRRLLQENVYLQQENARLLREVDNVKREYANLDNRLTRVSYRIHHLRNRSQSKASLGQVVMVIGSLVAVLLLLYYGMGFIDYSVPSPVDYDPPVIERHR